jgi:hypothetical protein
MQGDGRRNLVAALPARTGPPQTAHCALGIQAIGR